MALFFCPAKPLLCRFAGATPDHTFSSGTFGTEPRPDGPRSILGAGDLVRRGGRRLVGSGTLSRLWRHRPIDIFEAKFFRAVLDDDDAHMPARLELAEQQFLGQRLLDVLLDHAGHRPRAPLFVLAP